MTSAPALPTVATVIVQPEPEPPVVAYVVAAVYPVVPGESSDTVSTSHPVDIVSTITLPPIPVAIVRISQTR